jgi:RNA polymerase sigma-70 factor (ECF subfamily)
VDEVEKRRACLVKAARARLAEIHSFLRRLGVDAATAEDLAQDTFLIAWQRASRLRGERQLKGWLYGIAYRRYLQYRETARSQTTIELTEEVVESGADPGGGQRLSDYVVRGALMALPEAYAHPLVLVYWQGLSYLEAARVLSLPVGTLAWRVHKGLKMMRRALAEKGLDDVLATHTSPPDRRADPVCED